MPRQGFDGTIPAKAVETCGRRFRAALEEELREDPNAFGLRPAMGEAGERMVKVLDELHVGMGALGPAPPGWTGSNADWFLYGFVRAVAGESTGIVDAMVRRSATRCAEKILADARSREAIESADSSSRLAMDLFCLVYRFFFVDVMSEFVKAAVSEQIMVTLPALLVVDPAGQIPDWVGEHVAALIPDPCEQKHERDDDHRSVSELAVSHVRDNVDRALGLVGGASP